MFTDILRPYSTDTVKFNYAKLLQFVLKVYGLNEAMMTRCIEISISLDGADLTRTVSHVMVGIKIIDRFARNGLHGDYIFKKSPS